MAFLEELIATNPLYPDLDAGEVSSVVGLLEAMAREIDDGNGHRLLDRLGELGPTLFAGINPARPAPAFDAAVEAVGSRLRTGTSIYLELGAAHGWPQARVEPFIAEHRLGDIIRLDMDATAPIDVRASVTALPFADESIDHISSDSLFEHCAYPHEIIREAFRVLRPGGSMLVKAPFNCVEHRCPADYLRFTGQFFEEVCSAAGFARVEVEEEATSGVYYVAHQVLKAGQVYPHHPEARTAQRVHLMATALLGMLQSLDSSFCFGGRSLWHTTCALATKPGILQGRATAPNRTLPFVERYADILICPRSGLPLQRAGRERMASLDGRHGYDVRSGVPDLFVLHGFASSFRQAGSSRACLEEFQQVHRAVVPGRGWDVVPGFATPPLLAPAVLAEMNSHPWRGGESSWGTRNVLASFVLSMRPRLFVEFGGHIGCGAVTVGSALKANGFGRMICLEPLDRYFEVLSYFVGRAGVGDYVTPVLMRSTDSALAQRLEEKADMIFIDGDHGYSHARRDLDIAAELLADGGMIFLDDVGHPHSGEICAEGRGGVRQALLDFERDRAGAYTVMILDPPYWLNPCGLAMVQRRAPARLPARQENDETRAARLHGGPGADVA
jgi:predicted O-methyltransferase YrrM/SAM-dependent methyltransferase